MRTSQGRQGPAGLPSLGTPKDFFDNYAKN